jgi:hypothetical protein
MRTSESEVTVTDILDSDHLPIMISILEPVRKREALDLVEKLRDCELLQSLSNIKESSENYGKKPGIQHAKRE